MLSILNPITLKNNVDKNNTPVILPNVNSVYDEIIELDDSIGYISSNTYDVSEETETDGFSPMKHLNTNDECNNCNNNNSPLPSPHPPVYFGNGRFEYVSDIWEREMLITAWRAITLTNLWDFVSQPVESFAFSKDKRVETIYNKIEEIGYRWHSGCSFGCTMRNMQYLSINGEEKFKILIK